MYKQSSSSKPPSDFPFWTQTWFIVSFFSWRFPYSLLPFSSSSLLTLIRHLLLTPPPLLLPKALKFKVIQRKPAMGKANSTNYCLKKFSTVCKPETATNSEQLNLTFQAKQLCLAITHTLILERRHVPIVSRTIDVLVALYSHLVKIGAPLHRKVVGGSTSTSSDHHLHDSKRIADSSLSRVETHGKSIKHGSQSTMEKESRQLMSTYAENQSKDLRVGSSVILSTNPGSEDNVNTERVADSSVAETARSSSQSGMLGTGSPPLDSDAYE